MIKATRIFRLFANVLKAKIEILSDYKKHLSWSEDSHGLSGRHHCEMKEVWTNQDFPFMADKKKSSGEKTVGRRPESRKFQTCKWAKKSFDVCVRGKYLKNL